jgi:hypothetical protein
MQPDWTAHNKIILDKLTVSQLVTQFPAYHGTRNFITAFALSNLRQSLQVRHIVGPDTT